MSLESTAAITAPVSARKTPLAVPDSSRLAYIDGVRAIAILAVIGFHAHLPGFRGGFVGVDVFFVISGFLITRQIAGQMLAGRFSAVDFYARRILRILPPLLFVTVVTLAIAPFFALLPQEQHDLAKSAAATAAMMSNYYFTSGVEYFSPLQEINPLLHTWSLGVEEQYYLLVPAVMGATVALAGRRSWDPARALLGLGAAAIIVSYIMLAILTRYDHRLAFFSIMTRAWQFGLGGFLAVAVLRGWAAPARLRTPLGLIGFIAIAASVVLYTEHVAYPGDFAGWVPTLGTVLLLVCGLGDERSPLVGILASRPAVIIGLLSYSWYLWHWPLTELARTLPIGQDSLWKDVTASSVAFLLSIPTYLFLERPMKSLRRPDITRRFGGRIVAGGVAGSVLIAVLALVLAHSDIFDHAVHPLKEATGSEHLADCLPNANVPKFKFVVSCVVGAAGEPSVVFWGDSHAKRLEPIAERSARSLDRTALVFSRPACPPLIGVEIDYFQSQSCVDSNDRFLDWIETQHAHPITGIVLAGRWPYYVERDTPGGEPVLPRMIWPDANHPSVAYPDMLRIGLSNLLKALAPNRRVLIMAPVPELKRPVAGCLMRAEITGQPREVCAIDRREVEQRRKHSVQILAAVAATFPNVRLVDPLDVFCGPDKCEPFGANGLLYRDDNHMSRLGAEMVYRRFESDFRWVYGAGPAN